MSTTRRTLGTGPTTSTRPSPPPAPRLLPIERAQQQDIEDEHQEVSRPRGRRPLGERGR
ncbi:hypothetical protein [Streptomyces sp. NPDC090112]|uniref:hypothetical protein n=1 Tax=Streptomyces sp. NPDC090112 TaxID=3365949 RepID=UPI0037F75E8F